MGSCGGRLSCGQSRRGCESGAIQRLLDDGGLTAGTESGIVGAGDTGRIPAAIGAPDDKEDGKEFRAAADQQCGADGGWAGRGRRRKRSDALCWGGGRATQRRWQGGEGSLWRGRGKVVKVTA